MEVRPARPSELAAVMTVFDSGGLELSADRVRLGIRRGRVRVAAEQGRVLGAILVGPTDEVRTAEIVAVAVRPGRRGQGLGTALVETAAADQDTLVAEFDPRVRAFWASLGFEIEAAAEPGRFRGRLTGPFDQA